MLLSLPPSLMLSSCSCFRYNLCVAQASLETFPFFKRDTFHSILLGGGRNLVDPISTNWLAKGEKREKVVRGSSTVD